MSEPREKILGLVASGKISADEGQLLLGALKPARPRLSGWLFWPFERAARAQVWAAACATCALSLALRTLKVRFDGTIDLHVVEDAPSWGTALLEQVVAWPFTALVFWLLALLTRQPAPALDLLGFVGAARLPYLLAALVVAAVGARNNPGAGAGAALVIVATVVPMLIWTCWLLYHGLRTATGRRGVRLTLTFFAALLLAEIGSKLVLGTLS